MEPNIYCKLSEKAQKSNPGSLDKPVSYQNLPVVQATDLWCYPQNRHGFCVHKNNFYECTLLVHWAFKQSVLLEISSIA